MKSFGEKELMQDDETFFDALECKRKDIKTGILSQAMNDFKQSLDVSTEWDATKSGWGFKTKYDSALVDPYSNLSQKHQSIYSTIGTIQNKSYSTMDIYKDPNSHAGTLGNTYKEQLIPAMKRTRKGIPTKAESIYSPDN